MKKKRTTFETTQSALQSDKLTPEGGISSLLSITGAQMTSFRYLELLTMDPIFSDLNVIASIPQLRKTSNYLNTDRHGQNLL